jgi:hypothetical protein
VKPSCTRCNKSGQDCRYRDQTDLLFRDQTDAAAQHAEGSWRKRSKSYQKAMSESNAEQSSTSKQSGQEQQHLDHDSTSPLPAYSSPTRQGEAGFAARSERSETVQSFYSSSIAPAVRSDLCRLAYERFIYDFVTPGSPTRPPDEPSDALWTFVPLLYQHTASDSCLATIVQAVSYINFSNRCISPQAALLAEESFGKGLKLLSETIKSKEQVSSNDVLCSALLLGVFEVRPYCLPTAKLTQEFRTLCTLNNETFTLFINMGQTLCFSYGQLSSIMIIQYLLCCMRWRTPRW